jgi:large subunit ribosomal protein L24
VIVEGVNRIKRHTKVVNQGGRAGTTGGIVTQEAAIHVSNVMLLVDAPKGAEGGSAKGKVTTRVGYRRDDVEKRRPDGSTYPAQRSVRVSRKSGEEI